MPTDRNDRLAIMLRVESLPCATDRREGVEWGPVVALSTASQRTPNTTHGKGTSFTRANEKASTITGFSP